MVLIASSGFRVFMARTKSGLFHKEIPASGVKWAMKLNKPGTVDVTFPVSTDDLQAMKAATTPVFMSAGIIYDSTILECGPIWKREYDEESESVTVSAEGIWSIFDRRKLVNASNVLTPSDAVMFDAIAITGSSYGSIARTIVDEVTNYNSTWSNLNIVLPAYVAGTHDKTYNGFDLGWAGDRLYELTQLEGGPDIRFRPRFETATPNYVEWLLETGSDAQPLLVQAGVDWVWDTEAPNSSVVSLGVMEDASEVASFVWVPGNGQESDMKLSTARDYTLANLDYPWTEAEEAHKTVETQSVLDSHAARVLNDRSAPWQLWKLKVRADMTPRLGTYQPGDWASINVGPGRWIEQGIYRARIMGIEGDDTEVVTVVLAPIQGGV